MTYLCLVLRILGTLNVSSHLMITIYVGSLTILSPFHDGDEHLCVYPHHKHTDKDTGIRIIRLMTKVIFEPRSHYNINVLNHVCYPP